MYIRLNENLLKKKIDLTIKENLKSSANKKAYSLFKRAKESMLKEFDEHPVTLEIKDGPLALDSSGLLGGYGNLFSFIGFNEGSNPIEPIKNLLEQTSFRYSSYRNNTFYFKINLPSKREIEAASPMPWESGNSWTDAIEKGISNLSFFLFKQSSKSRSGQGLQVGDEVNTDISFKRTKYLSEILSNFRERVNNSKINS